MQQKYTVIPDKKIDTQAWNVSYYIIISQHILHPYMCRVIIQEWNMNILILSMIQYKSMGSIIRRIYGCESYQASLYNKQNIDTTLDNNQ